MPSHIVSKPTATAAAKLPPNLKAKVAKLTDKVVARYQAKERRKEVYKMIREQTRINLRNAVRVIPVGCSFIYAGLADIHKSRLDEDAYDDFGEHRPTKRIASVPVRKLLVLPV
jgi:hypothetical protein